MSVRYEPALANNSPARHESSQEMTHLMSAGSFIVFDGITGCPVRSPRQWLGTLGERWQRTVALGDVYRYWSAILNH